jgi:transcription elongation factor Elf1
MNKLSTKQKMKYLKNPHHCPKCGHKRIGVLDWDPEIQCQHVVCHSEDCRFVWREIFTMVDIEAKD